MEQLVIHVKAYLRRITVPRSSKFSHPILKDKVTETNWIIGEMNRALFELYNHIWENYLSREDEELSLKTNVSLYVRSLPDKHCGYMFSRKTTINIPDDTNACKRSGLTGEHFCDSFCFAYSHVWSLFSFPLQQTIVLARFSPDRRVYC